MLHRRLLPLLLLLAPACVHNPIGCGCVQPPTATITGRFTDASGAPLPGVSVSNTATQTGADGRYSLELRTLEFFRVYAQPWDGTHCYETAFSAPIQPGVGSAQPDVDLQFKATTPGVLEGVITPMAEANVTYTINVVQKLKDGDADLVLTVRRVAATLANATSSYHIEGLPAGDYRLELVSDTVVGWSGTQAQSPAVNPATVTAGGTTTVNLAF